jgi:PAP2 superfamily
LIWVRFFWNQRRRQCRFPTPSEVFLLDLEKMNWLRYNSYFLLVSAYCGIVTFGYIYFGILFQSPVALISLTLIPVAFLAGRSVRYLRDWIRFIILMLSYEALQGIASFLAQSRGLYSIYPIDRLLWGVNLTGLIQNFFYSDTVTDISSVFYSLHIVLVAVLALTLWLTRKMLFRKYVYALVVASYFSLVVFLLVPTSPPWYLGLANDLLQSPAAIPSGLPPLITTIDNTMVAFVSDKFAAFPSLHAAYAVLFGYYMTKLHRAYALFALPISAGILFSTLYWDNISCSI